MSRRLVELQFQSQALCLSGVPLSGLIQLTTNASHQHGMMNTGGNKSSSEIPLSPHPVLVTGTEFKELVHGNNKIPVVTCPGSFNPLRPVPAFCPDSLATGDKHIL